METGIPTGSRLRPTPIPAPLSSLHWGWDGMHWGWDGDGDFILVGSGTWIPWLGRNGKGVGWGRGFNSRAGMGTENMSLPRPIAILRLRGSYLLYIYCWNIDVCKSWFWRTKLVIIFLTYLIKCEVENSKWMLKSEISKFGNLASFSVLTISYKPIIQMTCIWNGWKANKII